MKATIFSITLAFGFFAQADMIKPATLDIICTESESEDPQVVLLISSLQGSSVTVNGETYTGDQLIAGTEGSDPYLQTVNNMGGYNITIYGGDFQEAFYESDSIQSGTASAYVNLFNEDVQFHAACEGSFSF